jgi:hypothetical protein
MVVFADFLRENNENSGFESIDDNKVKQILLNKVKKLQACWFSRKYPHGNTTPSTEDDRQFLHNFCFFRFNGCGFGLVVRRDRAARAIEVDV